jgi:hypothetical protein
MAKAQEPCVLEWMGQLNPNTKNYAYYFLRYYDWFRAKGVWEKPGQVVQWKSARAGRPFSGVGREPRGSVLETRLTPKASERFQGVKE